MSRRRLHRHRHGQGGFLLLMVLGVVLFLSVAGLALLAFVVTSGKASGSAAASAGTIRAVDGAFERAVHQVRTDPALAGATCAGTVIPPYPILSNTDTIQVTCADDLAQPFTSEQRVVDFEAMRVPAGGGAGTVVGEARVKIIDKINGTAIPGYSIAVCDWVLGRPGSRQLDSCPS